MWASSYWLGEVWSWSYLQASGECFGAFLDELLQLFHYPPVSARALLAGTLPLRYCAARFASRAPSWRLIGGYQCLDMLLVWLLLILGLLRVEDARREVHWVSGSGPGRKRIRLNRKPPAHLACFGVQFSAT